MSLSRLLVLSLAASMVAFPCSVQAASPCFECFAASDLVRVFEDGYACPSERPAKIELFGLRNEVLSAQCVVAAREDLKGLTVAIGPLQKTDAAARIPAANVSWNFVGSIFIQENTPKLVKTDVTRPAPAWFPDFLSEERSCALAKGAFKAVYLTIKVPRDAEPGEYHASVAFTAGGARVELPLALRIYPLAIPDQRHVMVTEWFSTHQFKKHHGVDPSDAPRFLDMLGVYARNMAEHRQNVFRVSLDLIESTRLADGQWRFDFSRFDRWAEVFWATGAMDLLETGFVARFGPERWSSTEIVLRDFSIKDAAGVSRTVPGKEFLPHFLPALVAHLRERGWLTKTVFHICDEPSNHNVMPWREASDFVHRCAPELRRLDAIETPHCLDRLEIWIPKLDHLATWREAYEDAQRRGHELWFYTVGIFQKGSLPNKTADVPLIESRLLHWLNYRFGLKGYLHWGFNAWTDDPIRDPGRHRGDGWHVYPKPGGLINSLRWEQMRNGLQDYECLWLLENKVAQLRARCSSRVAQLIDPPRRGREIAAQAVAGYHQFTRDPAVLYAARRQAIEETLDLDKPPRILLQTNPPEHSAVANDCAIDVHGWVEPGTTIRVNGQSLPVAEDGLFMEQMPPSREGTITVEAESARGKKTLVRKFKLLHGSRPAA